MMAAVHKSRSAGERGSALIIALVATVLLTALGLGLVMLTDTEGSIASNFRAGNQTLYAADAAVERVMADILLTPTWNAILQGNLQSAFIDTTLTPTLPSGQQVNLTSMTAEVQAQSDASAPWGANNPRWKLFAYGPIADMAGNTNVVQRPEYVAVWVADDPAETDGDPQGDTNGVITVLARAFGPYGTQRSIEVTLSKTDLTEIERGQIAQRGQEELNQRARKAAVQLPGKMLTASDMDLSTGGMVKR